MTSPQVRRAQVRYDLARGLALGLLVLAVLASLVVLLLQSRELTRQGDAQETADRTLVQQGEQLVRQGDQLEAILARQDADTADRATRLAAAIDELTAVQQAQLDAHDADVTARLQTVVDELGRLQMPPRTIVLPESTRPAPPAPAPGPAPTSRPPGAAPAPAPAVPCETRGNSGKCRR